MTNLPRQMIESFAKLAEMHTPRLKNYEFNRYLLDHGTEFRGFHKDKEIPRCFRKPRQCFYNAMMKSLDDPNYKYYEGQAVCITTKHGPLIPMDHAWLVKDGKVIDPTWQSLCKDAEYFGMEIPTDFIRKVIGKTGRSDAYIWQYIDTKLPK